jgi:hypothetical protein
MQAGSRVGSVVTNKVPPYENNKWQKKEKRQDEGWFLPVTIKRTACNPRGRYTLKRENGND